MSSPRSRHLVLALCVAAGVSACYVVPIDPRTGQPYPTATPREGGTAPTSVAIITPPASPAPPQQTVLSARLYPLNQQANQGGMLTAMVVDNHTGRGSFTLAYQGDTLQGEATRVDSAYTAYGRIHQEVLGAGQRSYSGRRGIANAYGSRGTNVQCEYLITGPTMGTGACLFSDGAKYQMHFGS